VIEGINVAVHAALPVKVGGVIIMMVSVGRLSGVKGTVVNGTLSVYAELSMLERWFSKELKVSSGVFADAVPTMSSRTKVMPMKRKREGLNLVPAALAVDV